MESTIRLYKGTCPATVGDAIEHAIREKPICVAVRAEGKTEFSGKIDTTDGPVNTVTDDLWALIESDKVIATMTVGHTHEKEMVVSSTEWRTGDILHIHKISMSA